MMFACRRGRVIRVEWDKLIISEVQARPDIPSTSLGFGFHIYNQVRTGSWPKFSALNDADYGPVYTTSLIH